MSRDEDVPGDVLMFLNRGSIQDLMDAKDRELSKGPMAARWKLVQMIDEELESRKASNQKRK